MSSSSTLRALAIVSVVAAAAAAAPADLCARALASKEPFSPRVKQAIKLVCNPAALAKAAAATPSRRSLLAESDNCARASSSPPVMTAHHPRY